MLFSRAIGSSADIGSTCVYSFSGGTASLAADLVGAAGLTLAAFSDQTRQAIDDRAPAFGFADNPVDLTTKVFTDPELNEAVLRLICADPSVGSVLFAMPADYGRNSVDVTRAAIEICTASDTLLVPVWMSPRRGDGYALLEEAGLAPFTSASSAVTAMRRLVQWRAGAAEPEVHAADDVGPSSADSAHRSMTSAAALAYEDAIRLVEPAGIRFPKEYFEVDADSAAAAAERIGGPVAVKLSAPGLIHKTEVGGVHLGVEGAQDTAAVVREMMDPERLAPFGLQADGVFVQEMIGAGIDLLLSTHRDEVFGPVVTIGAGGVATELEKDVVHLSVPFTRGQFLKAVATLRVHRLLAGFRGSRPYDLEVVFETARNLGSLFLELPQVAEIEINPLRVVHEGRGSAAVALDVVVLNT
jgi:acyl-CoA synthetase (NDP forming)